MAPSEFDFFQFLIDRIEFLLGLLIGGGGASSVIYYKIKVKQKIHSEQTASPQGSGNIAAQTNGANSPINIYSQQGVSGENDLRGLDKSEQDLISKIKEHCAVNARFDSDFARGKGTLESDVRQAGSAFWASFIQVRSFFLDIAKYREDKALQARKDALSSAFVELQSFSDGAETDTEKLKKIVGGLKEALWSIFPYIAS
ncbi:MAG: hypothetical protein WC654_04240 [Patescibacteria group bacterium]